MRKFSCVPVDPPADHDPHEADPQKCFPEPELLLRPCVECVVIQGVLATVLQSLLYLKLERQKIFAVSALIPSILTAIKVVLESFLAIVLGML